MNQLPKQDIDNIIYDILKSSKSFGVFPTPVDKIVQFCELKLSKDDFHIPKNYVSKNVDALKRMLKKVLGALDKSEKVVYVDSNLVTAKKTFVKLHEVGHSALPWQRDIHFLDDEYTLSADVKDQFEAEANYFASGALFQLDRFISDLKNLPLEIGSAMSLADKYGGSYHAAIRRYAERSNKRCALIVMERNGFGSNSTFHFKGNYQSNLFTLEFGRLKWPDEFDTDYAFINDFHAGEKLHTKGSIEIKTLAGEMTFQYHYFFNQYSLFILIFPKGEKNKSKTKIILSPPSINSNVKR